MNQKITITLTAISLSLVAFLSGYLISQKDFHKSPSSNSSGNILDKFSDNDVNTSPHVGSSETLRLLSPRSVVSPVLSKEKDSVLYYEKGTGKVFEVNLKDLNERSVSDVPLANFVKTVWAPSRKEVISLFYYPGGGHYKYFSYKTRASVDLGTYTETPAFSPDGSQIAYFGGRDSSRGVFISQPDGSSFKKILPSRLENTEMYWPSDNLLSFKTTDAGKSELYTISEAGDIKKLLESRDGLEVKWSKDGSRVLFSQKAESGIGLFYKDVDSESEIPLNVATEASKCDWGVDNKTLVCGVPKFSAPGDEIYEIGLDGTKKLISSPTSTINVGNIFLSGLEDYIVILNDLDNRLYVLRK
jgi:hypothetical protein